jgi:hypothetical protein
MSKVNLKYTPTQRLTLLAEEDLEPYRMVNVGGVYADEDEQMIGVTEIENNSGDWIDIITEGTCIVETSEAVTAGEWVSAAADGKGKVQDGGEASLGIAKTTVNGAGYIEVQIEIQRAD